MKKITILLIGIAFLQYPLFSQDQSYKDEKGQQQLCGVIALELLEKDSTYSKWFYESQEEYSPKTAFIKNKEDLGDLTVEIYLGTWCGDSKNWVPKFVELWDELGLKRSQLKFIALYDDDERYKQGPNGEEKGKNIHRVPTFIFLKDGLETARIVEHPANDLETDLAQIALGVPSKAAYKGANYLMNTFDEIGVEGVKENFKEVVNKVYRLQGRSSELNTLGYVYLRSGEIEKALTTFYMNTLCNKYDPNVYDSYAEALEIKGNVEYAIKYYEKSLEINAQNEHATERLAVLRKEE